MKTTLVLSLLGLVASSFADPTWPSNIDELEEIMYQLKSFRGRKFADTITPCTNEASGPGRLNAAEWLRTGFHDMAPHSSFLNRGGADGSLQYELTSTENKGPGLRTTIEFMVPFLSTKSSLSDLIALGVYASVRSCGGPVIPFKAGRKDVTRRGDPGVPQPENSVLSFQQQFQRMGFDNAEMIELTACGHTIGGVHTSDFADIIDPSQVVNGQATLDRTVAGFDNRIVTEYLDGTTKNPLVVGPSIGRGKNSDFKVFNSDRNVTMQRLADATDFYNSCQRVLQKMIEAVPTSVQLTEPIQPYKVKPTGLQLTLEKGGSSLLFTGYIRVRTTGLKDKAIDNVVITYKNRNGESNCGTQGCTITTTEQGVSQGFDDTFAFFPIEYEIPAATGISSFTVVVNYASGTSESFDNNGNAYPLQDAVLMQNPQSCLLGSTGAFTVTAAVRNDRIAQGAKAKISYKTPQTNSPAPSLKEITIDLVKGDCGGKYTLFTADYTIPGGRAYEARVDIINGDFVDAFKPAVEVGGTCRPFGSPATCDDGTSTSSSATSLSSTTTVSSSTSTTDLPTGSSSSSRTSESVTSDSSTTVSSATSTPSSTTATSLTETETETKVTTAPSSTSSTSTTSTSSSEEPTESVQHRETVGEYELVSCWSDTPARRTLNGPATASDDMTLEKCSEFCSDYVYWGTEYSKECFCGNSLYENSEEKPMEDCSMICGGDDTQYCGAGDRLELYSTTAAQPTTTPTTSTPAPSPTHVETVGDYALVGCWKEIPGGRALKQRIKLDDDMTNEDCAGFCEGFRYFATQYGRECYCGSHVAQGSESADLSDCGMTCAGDETSFCGGNDRLELYLNPDIPGGTPEQPLAAGDYSFLGCRTDIPGRALKGKATAMEAMTNEKCAEFCEGFEYFGTEYGSECYCGDDLSEESAEADVGQCDMLCSGSVMEYCGAGDRLSVYQKKEEEIIADPESS